MSKMSLFSFLAIACTSVFSAQMASQQWVMRRIEEATNNISGFGEYATIEEVDEKISTNNEAFVSAVLAVPLTGADAGDIEEIAEYGGYGAIGAALLALIAGLAALKRRMATAETALAQKASLTDLPYSLVEPGEWEFSGSGYETDVDYEVYHADRWYLTVATGNPDNPYVELEQVVGDANDLSVDFINHEITATRASLPGHLLDRAVNEVSVTGATTLTLPALVTGKSRDFYLRMDVTGSQDVSFSPSSGVEYTGYGNPAKTYSDGTYVLHFRETAGNEFCVTDMLERTPTKISDLTNDSGYVTSTTVAASYYNKNEIDGMIGDIDSVLDEINGEVI